MSFGALNFLVEYCGVQCNIKGNKGESDKLFELSKSCPETANYFHKHPIDTVNKALKKGIDYEF